MRGLEEKIWKVLAPTSWAFRAALSSDPAIDVCMPIRKTEGFILPDLPDPGRNPSTLVPQPPPKTRDDVRPKHVTGGLTTKSAPLEWG